MLTRAPFAALTHTQPTTLPFPRGQGRRGDGKYEVPRCTEVASQPSSKYMQGVVCVV